MATQTTHTVRKGQDAQLADVDVSGDLSVTGAFSGVTSLDLNGVADALILDEDADTTISAPTDDQIDIELGGVDHIVLKAVAGADSATTTSIAKIAFTSPVDTTGTNTHNGLFIDIAIGNASGGTNEVRAIAIDNITGDAQVTETGILLGTGFDIGIDMQGTKIDLDAAGTTSISAAVDNTIVVEVNGATDFTITANTFTANAGSSIATDTIAEVTGGAGVTADGVLCKDGVVKSVPVTVTADGAIAVPPGDTTYFITKAGVAAMTIVAPTATTHDGIRLTFVSTTAQAHTLDMASSGINGGSADQGTFGGAAGDGVTIVAYQAHWYEVPGNNKNVTWA